MIRGGWRGLAALTRLALSAPELDARSTRGAKDRDRALWLSPLGMVTVNTHQRADRPRDDARQARARYFDLCLTYLRALGSMAHADNLGPASTSTAHQARARASHLPFRQQRHSPAQRRRAPECEPTARCRTATPALRRCSLGCLQPLSVSPQVYDKYKDEDGFLYMTYSGENTFGEDDCER